MGRERDRGGGGGRGGGRERGEGGRDLHDTAHQLRDGAARV